MSGWFGWVQGANFLGANCGDYTTAGLQDFGSTNSYAASLSRALGVLTTSSGVPAAFAVRFINNTADTLTNINVQFTGELWRQSNLPKTLAFGYLIDPTGMNAMDTNVADYTYLPNLNVNFPTNGADVGGTNVDGTSPLNQTNISVPNQLITSWSPGTALWFIWEYTDSTGKAQGIGIDNFSFAATATPIYTINMLNDTTLTNGGPNAGLTAGFVAAPGVTSSFTVWSTTNLTLPFGQWQDIGHPTESPLGPYSFTDPSATTNPQQFYQVTSP
jgi:hypothetical protein